MAISDSDLKLLRLRIKLIESIGSSRRQLDFEIKSQAKRLLEAIGGLTVKDGLLVTLSADSYQILITYLRCVANDSMHDLPDRAYLRAYYDKIASDQEILNQL